MKNRLANVDSTLSAGASPRRQLVEILEGYLADLESGCAQDESALLSAHPELADELRPYLDSLRLLHGATRDIRAARFATNGAGDEEAQPHARQIGDYRIVREIGRGGMGIVYEAHQKSLNRKVALKVLPFAAVLDQRQIARFRNEAQAAAQLHHPHIVPVFAVGQELGVYYYAMQYIDGQSLEQAIGELRDSVSTQPPTAIRGEHSTHVGGALNGSTTTKHVGAADVRTSQRSIRHGDFFRTAARLGKEAAEALEHAHQFGIVHRDIKPSNLLLDEHGKLWVTDFGLARIQAGSGVTLPGDVVGTLRYMSPEQASGQTALIDVRTDVYSLGVTLYELLTQRQAFPGDDRQSLLRRIVSEEPIPPRRLNPNVPIDLETIVLSAMAKPREERYATAQALADDLGRFLAGEPTLARRPTLVDRAAKWARRHRPLVALGACALVILTLVSAVGVALLAREQGHTSAALVQSEKSAQAARASFERAERHFLQARGAVDQFGMRMADRLLEIPGAETVRRDVLIETLGYYRQFVAEAGDDPQLRHELALAHFKSGVIAAKLGAVTDAMAEYQQAQQLLSELAATAAASDEPQAQLAVTHNNLALLLAARGDTTAARDHYTSAIAIQRWLVDEHARDPVYISQLAESQANLGMLLDQTGDAAAAERSLRAAVNLLRPIAEASAGEPKYARNLAIACNNLSFVLRKRDADAAESVAREAIAILERLADRHPTQIQYQDDLALCSNNLAAIVSHKDRLTEAIDWHIKAIALHERLLRKAPAVVRHRSDLAISLNNLGVAYCRLERAGDADAAFARARELLTTLADDYPQEPAYRSSLAALLNNQALALAGAGRHDEAIRSYETAIQSQRDRYEHQPDSAMMREVLSKMYYNYGQSLQAAGKTAEAAKAAFARRDLWKNDGERLFGVAVELAQISGELRGASSSSRARQELDNEVVATLRKALENGSPGIIDLATDDRFAHLRGNTEFAALLAEVKITDTALSPPRIEAVMITLFNKIHEQRTASASRQRRGRRARPLSVEAIEGRLMLAATWLEFAPSNIPAAQYSLSFDSVNFTSSQAILPASLNQGGFIPPVLSNAGVTGNVVRSDNAEVFTDGMPMTTNGAPFIGKWFDFGGLDSANGNLRPAVISISDDGSGLQPNLESVFAGSPRQGVRASEGGAIPIADLLPGAGGPAADDRRMMVAEKGDESVHLTRLTKEARDESGRASRLSAAERPAPLQITLDERAAKLAPSLHANSISGEWARAMVFELAGGEPTELSRPALGDRSRMDSAPEDAPANDDTPLSNIRAHSGTDQLVAYRANNVQARAAVIEGDRHTEPIKESVTLAHSAVGQLNAFARGQNWQNSHSDLASLALTTLIAAHTLAPAIPGSVNNSPPNAAGSTSTEFEEIETAAVRSWADDDPWGPTEVAPLVMVLALEQARAASVRRAKKHATTLAWPPRRFAKNPIDAV